jgi:hypothetical protein
MRRSFKLDLKSHTRDPRHLVRGILGLLLAANLAAAWFVFQTPGGTLEELESELAAKRKQLIAAQQAVARLKTAVSHTQKAREAGDQFLNAYFLPRKHAYSMLEIELANAARAAGIRAKERTNSFEPVEGSDTLGMLNINANFEGTYADLIELLNALDRSKRLLIIEQLQATPQQGGNALAIALKLNAFFRLEGPQEAGEEKLLAVAAPKEAPRPAPPAPAVQAARPAPAAQPATAVPAQVMEPRSGPAPAPPRSRFFNRKNRPQENEQ